MGNFMFYIAIKQERLKTTLKAFTFSYLDIDDKRYFHDSKLLSVSCKLREKFVILKPDKGLGIVLLGHKDVNSLQKIFDDPSKFKKMKQDPIVNRLATMQKYLKTLSNKSISTITFTSDDIATLIQNLDPNKAHGYDMLKHLLVKTMWQIHM